mgnify:CR=1 FL=1
MMNRRALFRVGLGAAAALLPAAARSERARDHEAARAAVESGEALPLVEILGRVRADLGGEVIGTSFKRRAGRWIYEFKVIGAGGRLGEVYVDAASAQIVKREEP